MGNIEVKNLMEDLKPMIQGECRERKIFLEHPHSTFWKNFSGGKVTDWILWEGFDGTFTFTRDRLHLDITANHLHKNKTGMCDKNKIY